MSSIITRMAWQEILARTLDGLECQQNVSPEWLVNPATRRRLKLDQFYPQIGLAVRFVGLTARGQPRKSDWDLLEEERRDVVRSELCRQNGVELFLIDVDEPQPRRRLQQLRTTLSRLSRMLAQGERPDRDKLDYMPQLAEARSRLDPVIARTKGPDDLALYAELWRDRELASLADARRPGGGARRGQRRLRVRAGQSVHHERFGAGTVLAVEGGEDDAQISVRFEDGSERTFLASLVEGKLRKDE